MHQEDALKLLGTVGMKTAQGFLFGGLNRVVQKKNRLFENSHLQGGQAMKPADAQPISHSQKDPNSIFDYFYTTLYIQGDLSPGEPGLG